MTYILLRVKLELVSTWCYVCLVLFSLTCQRTRSYTVTTNHIKSNVGCLVEEHKCQRHIQVCRMLTWTVLTELDLDSDSVRDSAYFT
jgi:hypothetical protein